MSNLRTLWMDNILDSFIKVDDDNKKVIQFGCTCKEFRTWCLRSSGRVSTIKKWAVPCLHHARVFSALVSAGYTIKVPRFEDGPKKLTPKLRKEILDFYQNICQEFECEEIESLEVHRIIRGNQGGTYTKENCRPLCKPHHKKVHEMEPGCR